MGGAIELPTTIPLIPARSRPADFLRRGRQLVDMRKAEKLHRHNASQPEIAQAVAAMVDLADRQITDIDRAVRVQPRIAGEGRFEAALDKIATP